MHPSQWLGTIVHLSEDDQFMINPNNSFRMPTVGGVYGLVGDTGSDLIRAEGAGPLTK